MVAPDRWWDTLVRVHLRTLRTSRGRAGPEIRQSCPEWLNRSGAEWVRRPASRGRAMHLGVDSFVSTVTDPATGRVIGAVERMEHLLEEIALADQVGLHSFGIGEHHRSEYYDSAPHDHPRRRRRTHRAHPARQRGQGAQRGRPGAGVPAVRDPGPDLEGAGRPRRGARLLHRGVPAVRPGPRRLRHAVQREARAAAADPRRGRGDLVRAAPAAAGPAERLPATGAGPAADLGRGGRHPGVLRPRRVPRPAA